MMASPIGRRILEQRERLGMSQVDLAKLAGVTRQWLSLLELGEIESPGAIPLDNLAQALGVSMAFLLHGAPSDGVPVTVPPAAVADVREFSGLSGRLRRAMLSAAQAFGVLDEHPAASEESPDK